MNRKLSLFLIVSLLTVQVLSTLHMAEYGFGEHKHNGHVCDIYLYCEHTKYSTPDAAITLAAPEYVTFTIALPELIVVRTQTYRTSSPRAPPLFS